MKCKACKNDIPDGSVFCMFCGERQVKERKRKDEIKVPKPHQLPSGSWRIRLQAEGQSITEATPELCIAKAKAIRAGFMEKKRNTALTLGQAIDKYIASKDSVLSPSTIRGYFTIRKTRFQAYMDSRLTSINWQTAVNEEAKKCGPKTIKNSWGLMTSVLSFSGIAVPKITLPQVPKKELPWLTDKEIPVFLEAVHGKPCEVAALLALHSLRASEIVMVTPSKVKDGIIHVSGAMVPDKDSHYTEKLTNKNGTSDREVPIMIPRLQELLEQSNAGPNEAYVKVLPNSISRQIKSACRASGLPEVGTHGLRRSFASLCYKMGWRERRVMQVGGWADWQTMHNIYIKLDSAGADKDTQAMTDFFKTATNNTTN